MKTLKKVKLQMIITHNLWLKAISLIIAIIVWLYVSGELAKGIRV